MGTMMSDPFPVDVNTGSNAISVVAVVITAGRTRLRPAYTTASRISSRVCGSRYKNVSCMYVPISTPSSVAILKRAMKPYPYCDAEVNRLHLEHILQVDTPHGEVQEPWLTVEPQEYKSSP